MELHSVAEATFLRTDFHAGRSAESSSQPAPRRATVYAPRSMKIALLLRRAL